jgi:hypothetical protein
MKLVRERNGQELPISLRHKRSFIPCCFLCCFMTFAFSIFLSKSFLPYIDCRIQSLPRWQEKKKKGKKKGKKKESYHCPDGRTSRSLHSPILPLLYVTSVPHFCGLYDLPFRFFFQSLLPHDIVCLFVCLIPYPNVSSRRAMPGGPRPSELDTAKRCAYALLSTTLPLGPGCSHSLLCRPIYPPLPGYPSSYLIWYRFIHYLDGRGKHPVMQNCLLHTFDPCLKICLSI